MSRIFFAWELGANFGHINKVSQVAAELEDEAELFVAARNVTALRALAPDLKAKGLPAPYSPTRGLHKDEPSGQCYPGVLLTEGWDSAAKLTALIEAWRGLFELVAPDLIVAQAAPTALLAARGLGVKTAMLGSGWDAPPRAHPMPAFTPENADAVTIAHAQEETVLGHANEALAAFGAPPLETFKDLLQTDAYPLVAWPETDHFSPREAIEPGHPPYLGQLLSIDAGREVAWRNRGGARVLAYLRPGSGQFAAGVKALAQLGPSADVILASPGIDPKLADKLSARSVLVVDGPVRLDKLLPDCDLGLHFGSNGIGSAFLAHGVPQICLPTQQEQMMFAQSLGRAGLAYGLAGKYDGPQVADAIRKALANEKMTANARAVAERVMGDGQQRAEAAAADQLRALL